MLFRKTVLLLTLFGLTTSAYAQGTQVAFGNAQDQDSDLPLIVTSDRLAVDREAGTAIYTENVIAVQGEMRMSSDEATVYYDEETAQVTEIVSIGNVVLISGPDAAEGDRADYDVIAGTILMTGNVLVTQGPSVATSDEMTVYLDDGTALMTGRVRTVLQQDQ